MAKLAYCWVLQFALKIEREGRVPKIQGVMQKAAIYSVRRHSYA